VTAGALQWNGSGHKGRGRGKGGKNATWKRNGYEKEGDGNGTTRASAAKNKGEIMMVETDRARNDVHGRLTVGEFDDGRDVKQGGEDVADESIREQEILQPIQSDHRSRFPDQRSASR